MNQTFNSSRFLLLLKKYTLENLRSNLMSLAVLGGILTILFLWMIVVTKGYIYKPNQFALFSIFFILSGTIFSSTAYINFSEKNRAVISLTLPASQLEKYLIGWIYTVIFFPAIYIGLFYIVDISFIRFLYVTPISNHLFNPFSLEPAYYFIFIFYIFLNSISLLGAIYFEKLHFIKTAFAFFVLCMILIAINTYALKGLIPEDIKSEMVFSDISFFDQTNQRHVIKLKDETNNAYLISIPSLLSILFWISTYFKIKEKQV